MSQLIHSSQLAAPAREVFAWHTRPGALERLTPPWETIRIIRQEGVRDGDLALLELGPLRQKWVARHRDYIEGVQFVDEQLEGPFASWKHTHHFESRNGAGCVLEDRVEYELPLGKLGGAVAGDWIARTLKRTFQYRHTTLANDLARHDSAPRTPRTIVVSGASGLVGRQLCAFLSTGGHRVKRLVRHPARGAHEIFWDPSAGRIDEQALAGVDAVVHLAGAGVADERWTAARKREILDSRVDGTKLLARALAGLDRPPAVLLSASAVGYYGARLVDVDEAAPPGDDFLAGVCAAWEAAAQPARAAGIRVAHPRIGVVLTPAGGALAKLLPPFKLGLGATPGEGRNPVPWVALDDLLGAIHFALFHPALAAPDVVTMGELTAALGRTLGHPPQLRVPAAALRLLMGELAQTVLGGARLHPRRLAAAGFHFAHPTLPGALAHLLGAGAALTAEPRAAADAAQHGPHLP
jgi:uncharacterized protein (TIGR01777 family)